MGVVEECTPATRAALTAVGAVFDSLGRVLICLDGGFRIVHNSSRISQLVRTIDVERLIGSPVEFFLGADLFGESGALRQALLSGEAREGWRASIRDGDRNVLVSLTATPFRHDAEGICDERVQYIVVLRPAEDDEASGTAAPTFFSGMIARSRTMAHIFQLIDNLSGSDATVLLTGESGTGKEVVARAIHAHSLRRGGPFIAVNCAALPGELLESELFGHVRGAFTGATRDRTGRFDLAAHGTLFLDEIGDMPLHLQVKLLRVLQDRRFERVGESHSRTTDARIIAATHVELRKAVHAGAFREDLYYRLRVVPIEIPPLRERREDIEPLARYLLSRVAARHGRQLRFSPDALRMLMQHTWPGNVRELENAIEYAVAVVKGQTVLPEDFPSEIRIDRPPVSHDSSEEDEAIRIRAALESHQWEREEAARALGMSRTTLWRKMREHRIG